MRFTFSDGCWIIPPQRAVWVPPAYPHQTGSIGTLNMRTLYIRKDACPPQAPEKPRMIAVSPLLREMVLRIVSMPIEYDEAGQEARIIETFLAEIDWTPLHPVHLPNIQDARLRKIERRLTRSPHDSATLEEWAAALGISARTLSRLIQKETHLSFQSWRDQIRTFIALPMLAERRPLLEIADALGYETAWSFTAMFKRVTGKLPSRYFQIQRQS